MAGKSMGQFIQALRKANGFTQQNVADKLGVSNKAVSRWERDECAPDISLIPALAELLGVTCDELLKGERIFKEVTEETNKIEPRVEKQLKVIVNQTISKLKTQMWVSIALSLIGLIGMLGITYGLYLKVIGFAVEMVFVVAAVIITVISITRTKAIRQDNDLFNDIKPELDNKFKSTLATYSYISLFTALTVVVLSLAFMCAPDSVTLTVKDFVRYLLNSFSVVMVFLFITYIITYSLYTRWIMEQPVANTNRRVVILNRIQIALIIVAGMLFLLAPCFLVYEEMAQVTTICSVVGLVLVVICIGVFFFYICVHKEDRKELVSNCLKNVFIAPTSFILSRIPEVHCVDNRVYAELYNIKLAKEQELCGVEPSTMAGYSDESIAMMADEIWIQWNFAYLIQFAICVCVIVTIFEMIKWLPARSKRKR